VTAEDFLDRPGPLREEDALPLAELTDWLAREVPDLSGTPSVHQYVGGASNRTYLLSFADREYVVRTPPAGHKAASSHDMGREARVMAALAGRFPVPAIVAQCSDHAVIGQPFYVMERVRGVILRADPPPGLVIDPQLAAGLGRRVAALLAELHALDPTAAGLADLDRGPGYVQRQVMGWNDRYRAARLQDSPDGESVMGWLAANQPADVRRCLIHNDWRLDNFVLDPSDLLHVRAVLDWEMATIGDPLMDLGSALAYWVQSDDDPLFQAFRRQPSNLPGMPTRSEMVDLYCEAAGIRLGPEGFGFYEVFGLFRLAVIAQQIYYRFAQGQTHNPALAGFGRAVAELIARCENVIG
jgi:aminoglycoside phosphotransferase (APT) family kinase protein